jgi:SAM-dependent methyltransferase
MIGVDVSPEMLCVLREKAEELGLPGVLLLCQDLVELDLYGTVRAAVSTFDTFNHIGPLEQLRTAIAQAALFIEPGGVMIFDMNTPYKHQCVLGDQTFEIEADDVTCVWKNRYDAAKRCTHMTIDLQDVESGTAAHETICEYSYTLDEIQQACADAGLTITEVCDGERFCALLPNSERYLITAVKQAV